MRIRRPAGPDASPLPGMNEHRSEQKRIAITLLRVGDR